MNFLLDVNVLIALIDPCHVAHDDAHAWFASTGAAAWATCPITENGVIRIVGDPDIQNAQGSPAVVAEIVAKLRKLPGHVFWPDNVSLVSEADVDFTKDLVLATGDRHLLVSASQGTWRPIGVLRPQAVDCGRETWQGDAST